ncbi:hypothetical protein [Chondromyces apiculatus]|uniref:Uncharacterized protein n=1 Tax=Chondromyces apiculatus DSM 436 TaxID=1192034 RepID=A0A017TG95_9BACT|nr:hypothetical protein [Chondromyces apiculatus]EYF07591.1 Hypothetical protein CAP_8714 [Chondromyces apiculatus DSM 436]
MHAHRSLVEIEAQTHPCTSTKEPCARPARGARWRNLRVLAVMTLALTLADSGKSDAAPRASGAAGTADAAGAATGSPAPRGTPPPAARRGPPPAVTLAKSKHAFGMYIDMTMALHTPGSHVIPVVIPRMVMLTDLTVSDRDSGGDVRISARSRNVDLDAAQLGPDKASYEDLRAKLAEYKGITTSQTMDPRGNVRDVAMKWPPSLSAQSRQMMSGFSKSMESMASPLPAGAVGPGAQWQSVSRTVTNGVDIVQFASYTLKSIDGDRVVFDVTHQQLAAGPDLASASVPAGFSTKLVKFDSSGSGTTTIDLKSAVPVSLKLEMTMRMTVAVSGGPGGLGGPGGAGDRTTTLLRTQLESFVPPR